jgi:hypothetical protein
LAGLVAWEEQAVEKVELVRLEEQMAVPVELAGWASWDP